MSVQSCGHVEERRFSVLKSLRGVPAGTAAEGVDGISDADDADDGVDSRVGGARGVGAANNSGADGSPTIRLGGGWADVLTGG